MYFFFLGLLNALTAAINAGLYAENSEPWNLGMTVFFGLFSIHCAIRGAIEEMGDK